MAPIQTDSDLLDDALKNKTILPSWRSIFNRITSTSTPSPTAVNCITSFLSAPASQQALATCYNPFPPPSVTSKQQFEKHLAPINFTAADQPVDDASALPAAEILKDEALELSKTLNIDEVAALRIVVLEHQARPGKALLESQGGGGEFSTGPGLSESILRTSHLEDKKTKDEKVFVSRVEVYFSERRYVIKVATALMRAAILPAGKDNHWNDIGKQFVDDCIGGEGGMLQNLVESVQMRWSQGGRHRDAFPKWVKEYSNRELGAQVEHAWQKQNLTEIIHVMQLLFLQLYSPVEDVSATTVMKWFGLMKATSFLTEQDYAYAEYQDIAKLSVYVQGLTSIVSLAILQLPKADATIREEFQKPLVIMSGQGSSAPAPAADDDDFYITNPKALQAVTECLMQRAGVIGSSLASMAWVALLHEMHMLTQFDVDWSDEEGTAPPEGASPSDMFRKVLPQLFPTTTEAGIRKLAGHSGQNMLNLIQILLEPSESSAATSAVSRFSLSYEEDGLRMRNVLAQLMRRTNEYVDFTGDTVMATYWSTDVQYTDYERFETFLGYEAESKEDAMMISDGSTSPTDSWSGSAARKFWSDTEARKMLERTKNRFPHEPLPFLKIIRGIASESAAAVDYLTNMTSYTQTLPAGFTDYDILDENAATMSICLTSPLLLFPERDSGAYEDEAETATGYFTRYGGIVIPPGTCGVVISGSGSRTVVAWEFEYNALPLFGRILETVVNDSNSAALLGDLASVEVVNEIVGMLTILIASSDESAAALRRVPGRYDVPQVLGEASDMLGRNRDIISIVCDHLDGELNRGNVFKPFFVTGLEFLDSLIHIVPGRIWPYLARSSLLERHGRGGALARILSTVEVVRGTYAFTTTCLQLFEQLVEEAVRSCALHKGRKHSTPFVQAIRVPSSGTGGMGVTDIVQRDILLGFTRTAVDIFESYRKYKYVDLAENWDIGTRLARIFTTILGFAYGVDDGSDANNKLTSVLIPSAEHLVAVFLAKDASLLPLQPISETILDGVNTPESSLYLHSLRAWVAQVVQVVKFADMLVRVRMYLELPPSQLEKHLYTDSPILTKLYAANEGYKRYVLELLESLVKASGSNPEEPPSLLGYLGATIANHFVTLLVTVDKPYQEVTIETRVWNFVTAVVSHKQQGMSILLLRGETLRQGAGAPSSGKKQSVLSVCLDALEDISKLPVEKTLAMLETVSTAQNFWSLAMEDLGKHPKFLPTITKHVETFTIEMLPADSKELVTEKAHKICVAAYIARILALYLHSRRPSERDETFFKQLLPKLNFYFEKAVKISGYRASLHAHLQKNFEEKWPGVKLNQIKKTKLRRKEFGTDAIYDVALAGKVLGFDPNWEGRVDSYKNEVEQANLNLSLVQTQVNLLQGWQLLAVELCTFAKSSPELTTSLLTVVESCLKENIATGLPAPIFSQIIIDRSEFAFIIVEKLSNAVPTLDLSSVFAVAWKGINSSITDFRAALANADMLYYRSLLRIIYLCLRSFHARPAADNSTKFTFTLLDLLDLLICKGFKDIAQAAHSHPEKTNPDDLSLLIAILQSTLRLKSIEEIHPGLHSHLAEQQTVRAATTLFSWSENLPGGLEDPVYPELALKFLLALSTVECIAEHLAIENTLASILSSTLAQRLHSGNTTPFSAPRLHSVWARGLLPLALNLLATIGARVGREVVGFLLFFKPQLDTAIEGWRKPTVVTVAAVEEAVGIALVLGVLEKLGGRGELGVDTGVMEEGVAYLLGHRNYLKSLCVEGEEEAGRIEEGLGVVQSLLSGEDEE